MPAKRMRPELMWGIVERSGYLLTTFPTWGRKMASDMRTRLYPGAHIVRVRVTQYKPRKRHAP